MYKKIGCHFTTDFFFLLYLCGSYCRLYYFFKQEQSKIYINKRCKQHTLNFAPCYKKNLNYFLRNDDFNFDFSDNSVEIQLGALD
jgi:hypothetical protein